MPKLELERIRTKVILDGLKRNMSRGNSLSDELNLNSALGDTRAFLYSPVLGVATQSRKVTRVSEKRRVQQSFKSRKREKVSSELARAVPEQSRLQHEILYTWLCIKNKITYNATE